MADEALMLSTRVVPARLQDAGFRFVHPEIEDALRAVQRGDVLQNELRRVTVLAVLMPLDVEPNHVVALCQKSVSPAA